MNIEQTGLLKWWFRFTTVQSEPYHNNEIVTDERDLIDIDQDELFVHFWNMIDYADMEDPPRAWIPKNKVYQVEGELEGRLLK